MICKISHTCNVICITHMTYVIEALQAYNIYVIGALYDKHIIHTASCIYIYIIYCILNTCNDVLCYLVNMLDITYIVCNSHYISYVDNVGFTYVAYYPLIAYIICIIHTTYNTYTHNTQYTFTILMIHIIAMKYMSV